MSQTSKTNISEQLNKLQQSLAWFDSEDFNLDEAVQRYEESSKIADDLKKSLEEIRNKVEILKQNFQD